ncbi:MAG TPA: alpha-amylase family glycosyl hydrolase [Desulfomonilia bacterium]|nr:alpha-amylase family glycosyl hydrolase [Desulfomonilia bacterium]
MRNWPKHPRIYEINTWLWLEELSRTFGYEVTLADVPQETWNSFVPLSLDAVWLMGVWERSPAGIGITMMDKDNQDEFRRVLPDFRVSDIAGSPYCVRRFEADQRLGGASGLSSARKELAKRGLRLILDYVPNHVAPDHPWVTEHPEYFIHGTRDDLLNDPASYREVGENILACGRDPFFPAWKDVLQLNSFNPGARKEAVETVLSIAASCDGIRCDMAMLLINDVFQRTWGERAGKNPGTEFWPELIMTVKKYFPYFLFIAEAYWDLEWPLLQHGFDYCYDKRLYDRLSGENAESVRYHLRADLAYQEKLVRFIENHDEPRAASLFSPDKARAAALVMATVPGAKLFHDGQMEGRRIRVPIILARRPDEPVDHELKSFYARLFQVIDSPSIREGTWRLLDISGWPDNSRWMNIVAWSWQKGKDNCLIVVNLSDTRSQARIHLSGVNLAGRMTRLTDLMNNEIYERSGNEMAEIGLYVDLDPWTYHVLMFEDA